jgi:hypothetical protein
VVLALLLCMAPSGLAARMRVPATTDWVDRGVAFTAGEPGAWDLYLWGGFALSAVKKGGTFFLYYQGSSGYDEREETVIGRAVGVATSRTGLDDFVKSSTPLIRWHPSCPENDCEEGAASAGAFVATSGEVHIYYGANTLETASTVNADGRLATSADGLSFVDRGVVLDHRNASIWGAGDELFPVVGVQGTDRFVTYYIPNGTGTNRTLGAAWGPSATSLTQSGRVTAAGAPVSAWGGASAVHLGDDVYAVFVSVEPASRIDVYTVSLASPHQFTGPVATYAFPNMSEGTVLFDSDTATWFLYYRNQTHDAYGVRTARLAPEPPTNLRIIR